MTGTRVMVYKTYQKRMLYLVGDVRMTRRMATYLIALLATGFTLLTFHRFQGNDLGHNGMNHGVLAQVQSSADPTGTVDGARNPELISDFKAYEVFCHSVAVSASASDFDKSRARNKHSSKRK
jgi:hypothetical protein